MRRRPREAEPGRSRQGSLSRLRVAAAPIPGELCWESMLLRAKQGMRFKANKQHSTRAHRAGGAEPGVDALHLAIAQAAVGRLPYVASQRRDLVKQRVLRQVATLRLLGATRLRCRRLAQRPRLAVHLLRTERLPACRCRAGALAGELAAASRPAAAAAALAQDVVLHKALQRHQLLAPLVSQVVLPDLQGARAGAGACRVDWVSPEMHRTLCRGSWWLATRWGRATQAQRLDPNCGAAAASAQHSALQAPPNLLHTHTHTHAAPCLQPAPTSTGTVRGPATVTR